MTIKGIGGRPKIPDEVWEQVVAALEEYGNDKTAVMVAGIERTALWRKQKEDPEFAERCKEARSRFGGTIRQRYVDAAKTDPKLLKDLDKVANPEDYAKDINVRLRGGEGYLTFIPRPTTLDELPEAKPLPAIEAEYRTLDEDDNGKA